MKADLGVEQGVSSISTKIINWCYQVSHSRHADYVDIQRVTSPMLVSAAESGDKTEIIAANVLHRLAINFSSNKSMDTSLEDTFVHGVVGDFVRVRISIRTPSVISVVVGLELIECIKSRANGQLGAKRKRDASKLKPDFIVFVTQTSRKFNVGVAEVNPPGRANSSNDGESDLVKLGREMQYMLNQLINDGVQNPVVGGILLQGYNMSTYKLSLNYHHVYTLVQLSELTIFNNIQGILLLPPILENLIQIKSMILQTAIKAKKCASEKASGISPVHMPPLSYIAISTYNLEKRPKSQ